MKNINVQILKKKKLFRVLFILITAGFLFFILNRKQKDNTLELISVDKIWSNDRHNAFTSLAYYKNEFYVVFREAKKHNSREGKIKLIKSTDTKKWTHVASVSLDESDLRDPKVIVNKKNQLIVYGMSRASQTNKGIPHYTHSWILQENKLIKSANLKTNKNTWKWGINRIGEDIMSIAYSGKDKRGTLYRSTLGYNDWSITIKNIFPNVEDFPSESSFIQLQDKSILTLLRKNRGNKKAMIGHSKYPYQQWNWQELDKQIGGPSLIQLSNDSIYACVRLYDNVRTSLCKVDTATSTLQEIFTFPSGNDTSYAGMVQVKDTLYISYYSNHQAEKNLSDIFLSKVKIN